MNHLTSKQRTLRYSISIDFECMRDNGYSKEKALDWFSSKECWEDSYDGEVQDGIYIPTSEKFLDVVKEVSCFLSI